MMLNSKGVYIVAFSLLTLSLAPNSEIFADPSQAVSRLRQYANQHGFPIRQVQSGPAARRVKRYFAPITPQSINAFYRRYTADQGFIAFSYTKTYTPHLVPNLRVTPEGAAADCYLWGLNFNGQQQTANGGYHNDARNSYMTHRWPGWIAAADLHGEPIQHIRNFLTNAKKNGSYVGDHNNCMEWLPNVPVGPNQTLFHYLGIKRSRDGNQMAAKFTHASNKRVEVFGVRVANVDEFKQMTDQQLLGPAPKAGVEQAYVP